MESKMKTPGKTIMILSCVILWAWSLQSIGERDPLYYFIAFAITLFFGSVGTSGSE